MEANKLEELDANQVPENTQKVLQWLLDPTARYKGSGRTTQILIALVEIAIRNPGEILRFRDHFPYLDSWKFHTIMNRLLEIAKRMYPRSTFSVYGDLFVCRDGEKPRLDSHLDLEGERTHRPTE